MNRWIERIFEADQAQIEGVVRRATRNVESHGGGLDELVAEARRRGFHVVETGDQIVILCHGGILKVHC